MELINFKGTLYGKLKEHMFVFDSAWESFRPIKKIAWNGHKIITVYPSFDIFDPYYGYGSSDMKQLCQKLTEITELGIPETDVIPWIETQWWRDRKCTFENDCTSRTDSSWLRYIKYTNSKPKTLRRYSESRATKRLMPK
jgi:hypothetical protein